MTAIESFCAMKYQLLTFVGQIMGRAESSRCLFELSVQILAQSTFRSGRCELPPSIFVPSSDVPTAFIGGADVAL
jgi:hypothetical protein